MELEDCTEDLVSPALASLFIEDCTLGSLTASSLWVSDAQKMQTRTFKNKLNSQF